jgi:tetratricopeptide (TPR) repeat protein
MSRRSRVWLLAVGVGLFTCAGAARADDVAEYLRRHGLHRLLAVHLEQQLQGLGGDARNELVLELAGIYAQLLGTTKDPALLADLQERSHRLLAAASPTVGEELRLALLRGSYRGAESLAERHRLRQIDEQGLTRARETLSEIIPKLTQLRGHIEGRLRRVESRLMRSGGTAATELARQAEVTQGLLTQCTFLTAWALYYQSWLNDRPDNARVAEGLFAGLLTADSPRLQPQDVPVDLRGMEAMARSILGTALCKSLTASSATAIEWLELLAHERANEELREQLPAWKMVVHLEHGEYRAARSILAVAADEADGEPPLAWIRLAAVHALEAEHRNRQAAELARLAVAMLAARGELPEVLDLAERYGTEALGESGFAFRYVRGVQHYDRARAAHGHDEPAGDDRIDGLYGEAINQFEQALAEDDAERYPEATASCRWLIGWCRFFQGGFLPARDAFELAAAHLGPDQAPEALWMAVVCLDRAVEAGGDEALGRAMLDLIDEALARYPVSPRAAKLRLKRALQSEASPEVVEELLGIPAGSDVYAAARRRAAQILYQLFRQASGEQRLAYGNEYLSVALPLLGAAADELDHTDRSAVEEYVTHARRVLEVALADGIGRATAAGTVLADLDALAVHDGIDLAEHEAEIDGRRVQQRLAIDDTAAAEAIADRLWERDRESVWTRVAERALFRYGVERWRGAETRRPAEPGDLRLVIRHGRRILQEYEGQPDALSQRRVLVYHATVAEALQLEAHRTGNRLQAEQALDLFEKLLAVAPSDARLLRAAARLSEQLGRIEQALGCWRTLVAGSAVGTEAWFEARYHLIALLVEVDPARARAVMDQHKQLNPDYGPEPWASRMRQLDLRIPPALGGKGKPGLPLESGGLLKLPRANESALATHGDATPGDDTQGDPTPGDDTFRGAAS